MGPVNLNRSTDMEKPKSDSPNLFWTRTAGSEDYFDRADQLRARFKRLAAVSVVTLCLLPVAAFGVFKAAMTPNPVTVFADGRLFSGELTTSFNLPDAVTVGQMESTVRVLLARTDKGGVPAVRDYVGPGITEYIDNLYQPTKDSPAGFTQRYSISNTRILAVDGNYVALGIRGVLSSRTLDNYQSQEVFWVAGFQRGPGNKANAQGWRLIRLIPDALGDVFFSEELAREKAAKLGLEIQAGIPQPVADTPQPPSSTNSQQSAK